MATTKVSGPMPTEVRTVEGEMFYLRGNKMTEGKRYCYFMYKAELEGAFYALFNMNITDYEASVMYGQTGKTGKTGMTRYLVERNVYYGISIGCKIFDKANTRKLARFAGVSSSTISKYFPSARAAAAGR
jgi:hypothetical protein